MKDEQADEKVGSGRGGVEPMASSNVYSCIVASSEFAILFLWLPSSYLNPHPLQE